MTAHRTGREAGTWVTTKGYSFLDIHEDEILARVDAGEPLDRIAPDFATSSTNLGKWVKKRRGNQMVKCILGECDKTFPFRPGKLACCRKHIKRYNARGKVAVYKVECGMPECSVEITNPRRKYCSKSHRDRHLNRKRLGYYERLQRKDPRCVVCGEWRLVDEHHIHHEGGKSDKEGPVTWLCPTHHLAIHRGFAVFDEGGGFKWITRSILAGLKRKHPDLLVEA